jgi:hypothetical protein
MRVLLFFFFFFFSFRVWYDESSLCEGKHNLVFRVLGFESTGINLVTKLYLWLSGN